MERTPLYPIHKRYDARMIDFGGWEMPVHYTGILAEHQAVRNAAGLFDVSHMGEFLLSGPDAFPFLQRMTTNDLRRCKVGQAQYTLLCTERGTVVDDLIVYRLEEARFLLCVNAANRRKDFTWLFDHRSAEERVVLEDVSDDFALLALQGPRAAEILAAATPFDPSGVAPFHLREGNLGGIEAIVARTGYTGEDGFELFLPPQGAVSLWERLMEAGTPLGLLPAGLGARDTLRLEMGYSLYGHELTEEISPLEAGLSWVVKLDKGPFVGRDALAQEKEKGPRRRKIGFTTGKRGIPRQGYAILHPERDDLLGSVTSGSHAPSLGQAVGMGLVERQAFDSLTRIRIAIRKRQVDADVVPLPFYRRTKG